MKNRIILLATLLFSFNAVAQESKESKKEITSIYDLMNRRDLNLKTVEKLADDYFKIKGTQRGSGYKQYQRWLHEARFHVDKDLNFISPQKEMEAYEKFAQNSSANNNRTMAAPIGIWTEIGPLSINPTVSWNPGYGKVSAIAIHPSNTNIIYVGTPGGGIWKSTNAGSTWIPILDNNAAWISIGAMTISPSNQSVIYASAGENSEAIIKSTNAGLTWSASGSGITGSINYILNHPTNSNILFATGEFGIYRSTNAGASWTNVYSGSRIGDLEFKPSDPNIMTAAGDIILRSTNNGQNWIQLGAAQGITTSDRTKLAVSPNNPNYVYAIQANGNMFGRLYLSTDAGANFTTRITGDAISKNFLGYFTDGSTTGGLAFAFMDICTSPTNADEVHIGGINTWKSSNAGASFIPTSDWVYPNTIGYTHADISSMLFVGNTLYVLSDGGLCKSTDNGDNYTFISNGLGIKQFYYLASSPTVPKVIVAGAQDNGIIAINSAGTVQDWAGSDAFECIVSPSSPSNIWGSIQNGQVYRSTDGGKTRIDLGNFGGKFFTSMAGHPTNENIIFGAGAGVFKSTNGGISFSKISGNTITLDLDEIAVAPSNSNYIYASAGNFLYFTTNGGTTWSSYTVPNFITKIAVSPVNPAKLWFTSNQGEVYKFNNINGPIQNLTGNLPKIGARAIAVDYSSNENLYVGMSNGVYTYSNNDPTWTEITSILPRAQINDMEIQKSSGALRVATFGRGIWEYNTSGAACVTDYEPNNTSAAATFIFKNVDIFAAISDAADQDHFTFNLKAIDNVTISLTNLPLDYDMEVFSSTGASLGSSANGGTNNELITLNNLAAGNYKVRVIGYNNAFSPNCYKLFVKSGKLFSKGANVNSSEAETEINNVIDEGLVLYPNPTNNQLNVDLSNFKDVFSVLIMNKEGFVQLRQDNIGDNKHLNFNVSALPSGIYFVQILSVTKELKTLKLIKE
jgi:photosystem II stability/assembly factor-like uncharacterized protein